MNEIQNITRGDTKLKKKWYMRWWGIIIILISLYLIATFILLAFFSDNQNINNSSPSTVNKVQEADLYKNTADDPSLGNEEALVRIVEFSDFQCPFCQQSFSVVREILNKYGNDIYFTYRDFPVSQIHPESLKAAEAGQCAHEQDKFWLMHDKIFINQENIEAYNLKRYALEIGLDADKFNNCLDSGKYSQEVNTDYIDGIGLGVVGTPTFFINGYRISGSIPKDIFIKLIEQAKLEFNDL